MRYILVVMATLVAVNMADIYMHNPRGSNNRLNERSANRQNANRAFDSQNNNRGGYNVGDKTAQAAKNEDGQYDMSYFQSSRKSSGKSFLTVEWTNQHGCGGNEDSDPHKLNCQLVMQYMCEEDTPKNILSLRNGATTATQTYTANGKGDAEVEAQYLQRRNGNVQANKVLFESWEWYDKCRQRNRNKGLFTADQKLKGDQSIYTRQNAAGTRRGYECPEERDYYPYWHPTDWKDIVVLTSNKSQCAYYQKESFNVKPKYECVEKYSNNKAKHWSKYNNEKECIENKGSWLEFNNYLERASLNEAACKSKAQEGYFWGRRHGQINKECLVRLPKPDCDQGAWSRVNHLGNGREGVPLNYTWQLPSFPSGKDQRCILRIRYNISTDDYDPWTTNSSSNQNLGALKVSPVQQNPVVDVGAGMQPLRLAINTAQFGRTFQDRSHVFKLWSRDKAGRIVPEDKNIYNLNVRGKRGNIVQTYPAVEYDFIPNRMRLNSNKDLLHVQWTGSNSHNNGNPAGDGQAGDAGEGTGGTDRNNMVETMDPLDNFPMPWEKASMFKNAKVIWTSHQYKSPAPEDVAISLASSGYYSCLKNNNKNGCKGQSADTKAAMNNLLNNAPASYPGMVLQFSKGEYFYTCTRNNNFSNRSQKGRLNVK